MTTARPPAIEQVTIAGTTYDVIDVDTPESQGSAGRHNLARIMRERKQSRHLTMLRPRGWKVFFAVQFENGAYTTPVDMGYWK